MPRYQFDAPRLFIEAPLCEGSDLALTREHTNYLANVLRLAPDDEVLVFNGRDGEWRGRYFRPSLKIARLRIESQSRAQERASDLHYFFAPLKHARLDYMVQKAVEMGVSRLQPVMTHRTQVTRIKLSRLRANAIEAAEQCGILALPEIAEPVPLERLLDEWPAERHLVFCDEDAPVADPLAALASTVTAAAPLAVLVGPEGGFDAEERASIRNLPRATAISLGPRILRADTAAVAALAIVQAAAGDWR